MQSPPDIMDFGGRAAIDVGDLLAIEVVTRTAYPPDVARPGGATRTSVIRRYELLTFAQSRELLVFGKAGEFMNFDLHDCERRVDDLLHVFGDAALCIRTVEAAAEPAADGDALEFHALATHKSASSLQPSGLRTVLKA